MGYLKNPLNYQGGKFKLFDQIFPLFPKNINTFVDLFGGSGEVGLNYESNKLIYNEKSNGVFEVLQEMRENQNFISQVDQYIAKYNLSKTNKDGYMQARSDYNNSFVKDPVLLYVLVCHSFANQIRFNKKQEFNVPFGLRTFNENMRANAIAYIEKLKNVDISFENMDFAMIDISKLTKNDFVYMDPPYLVGVATYNANGGWNRERERELLDFIDKIDAYGVKFALSNVIDHKGKENDILKDWAKKYKIHYLQKHYANCNHHTKDRNKQSTKEVLITNFLFG